MLAAPIRTTTIDVQGVNALLCYWLRKLGDGKRPDFNPDDPSVALETEHLHRGHIVDRTTEAGVDHALIVDAAFRAGIEAVSAGVKLTHPAG